MLFRSSLSLEQKSFLASLAMYWVAFVPLFFLTVMLVFPPSIPIYHFPLAFTIGVAMSTVPIFPLSLFFLTFLFSIPTIVSSLFVRYSNKKYAINIGIVKTIGIAGITFLFVMSFIPVLLLIEIFFPPSSNHYQSPVKAGIFIIILFFYCFFVLPVISFSVFLAGLIERWDSNTTKS